MIDSPVLSALGGPGFSLSIGQLSRRTGVARSALRFYEARSLIQSERNASGYREYPRAVLRRVAFIVFAQRVGLTLDEIARELEKLPPNRVPTRQDWAGLSVRWTERIDERIAELQRLRGGLTDCTGCGCLSLDRCRLANPADRAARSGPGPRYWLGDPKAPDGEPLPGGTECLESAGDGRES